MNFEEDIHFATTALNFSIPDTWHCMPAFKIQKKFCIKEIKLIPIEPAFENNNISCFLDFRLLCCSNRVLHHYDTR